MKHVLPTDTVNKILNYLASKAYGEVHQLIAEIQKVALPYLDPAEAQAPAAPSSPAAPAAVAKK